MTTSAMVAEDKCQTNHGSKSVEPSIKIDSISIDLIDVNEKVNAEKCDHFSIRGFVSEVRQKDWKICWPFTLDSDRKHHDEHTCVLPCLHVPRFKFWRCEHCLQELEAKCINKNSRSGLKPDSSELKSNKNCTHTSAFSDTIRILSNCQPGTKRDSLSGKTLGGTTSVNLNDQITEFRPLLFMDLNENSSNGMSSPKGNGMRSKAKHGQEISILATVAIEATSILEQKAGFTDNKASEPKRHRRDIHCQARYASNKVGDATLADKQKNINTANICGIEREDPSYRQLKEPTAAVTSGEAEHCEGEPDATGRSLMNGHPSVELNMCDHDTSSKSAEALIGNGPEDSSKDDSGGLPHRKKTRKVRLLTELLGGNGDKLVATSSKSQDSQLNEVSDASAGVEKLPPDGQVSYCKRGLGHGKKRKPTHDENGRSAGISFPNKVHKNVNVEATDATANTEDMVLAFARMKIHSGKKNQLIIERVGRSPFIGKKKKQKTWSFGNGFPASTSSQDIVLKELRDKSGYQSTSDVIIDSGSDAYMTREMDLFPLPARTSEPEHSNDKMKCISHEVVNPWASQRVWNDSIYREGPMTRKDGDASCSGSASHQFHLAADASFDQALNLCLNSYTPLQKFDFKCYPQLEERRSTSVRWQEGPSKHSDVGKASEKYVESFGSVPRPSPIASTWRAGVLRSKKPDTCRMPYLNEKQNYTSPLQIGNCTMQHKELCGASGHGKSTGVNESVILLKGGNHLAAGKGSELGAVDFPMDVVELMAKNQYERCLPDSGYNKGQLETPICTNNVQMIDFRKVQSHRELSFSKQGAAQKQPCQTKTARSGPNVGSTIQKPVDFFAQADENKVRTGQQKQAFPPVGFRPFLDHQEKPSGGLQHSLSSSSKQNSLHARKWIEDAIWKMPACTGYPSARSCNTCQNIPQQNKESKQPWSPLVTNQTSFLCNFPQNGAGPSTNLLVGHPECPRKMNTGSIWGFQSQSSSNLGKQTRNIDPEFHGGTQVDDPFSCRHKGMEVNQNVVASSDRYSNETIPAMHLLSLMDPGLSSNGSIGMDGNNKFFKRPPIAPPKKAYGACKTSNILKTPPCGKSQFAGSYKPIPGVPNTFSVSGCSFQNDRSFKRIPNITSQASQVREKRKGPDLCMSNNIHKLQVSASPSNPFGANCGSVPVHSMKAIIPAAPDAKAIPLKVPRSQNSKKRLYMPVAVNHHNSSINTEVCSINRNPAEFTTPEAGNVYMIAGEDLKFLKSDPPAKGSRVAEPGRKRWLRKQAFGKGKGQPSAS